MNVTPHNTTPILVCTAPASCGWQPHRFVRSDRVGNGNARQLFACSKCAGERVFGVVDLNASAREET